VKFDQPRQGLPVEGGGGPDPGLHRGDQRDKAALEHALSCGLSDLKNCAARHSVRSARVMPNCLCGTAITVADQVANTTIAQGDIIGLPVIRTG
jgi:hypothetical protein